MHAMDGAAVTAWACSAAEALDELRVEIDRINVYPVADRDTGSNLARTVAQARAALIEAGELTEAGTALDLFARGAVGSARGNSGIILAQALRGFANAMSGAGTIDGAGLADALVEADRMARTAVTKPVDGTMLTVLHAATMVEATEQVSEVAASAAKHARAALADTPRQLPVLATAGVVDAGGAGVVAVLDALAEVLAGGYQTGHRPLHTRGDPSGPDWEVIYQVTEVDAAALAWLRGQLESLGDSVTIAEDGAGGHAVHVHCADIGAAIEAGLAVGRPRRIRVESLQVAEPSTAERADRGIVAIVRGAELADFLRANDVTVLSPDPDALPATAELRALITDAGARQVTVLAGGTDLTAAAEAAVRKPMTGGQDVVVIPCGSPVQVLAALAVHDPDRKAGDDVVAMAEAAAATRRGELVVTKEESLTWVGRVQAGQLVGLIDDEVVLINEVGTMADAGLAVLNQMLATGGELVTIVRGAHASEATATEIADRLRVEHPEIELVSYSGGQHEAVLLFGVE